MPPDEVLIPDIRNVSQLTRHLIAQGSPKLCDPKHQGIVERAMPLIIHCWRPELSQLDRWGQKELTKQVQEIYHRTYGFGPLFWWLMWTVASAIISELVQRLIAWWWERSNQRTPLLKAFQAELR